MDIRELREERAALAAEIKRLAGLADSEDWTPEHEENWDKVNRDYDDLSARIAKHERAEEVQTAMAARTQPRNLIDTPGFSGVSDNGEGPTQEDRAHAFRAWCRAQYGIQPTDEQSNSCQKLRFNPFTRELDVPLFKTGELETAKREYQEKRALSVTTTAGGHTIPEGFVNELERALLAFGGVRQVASVIRTDSGNDLPWPSVNDTGNAGVLLAINTQVATDTDPAFGQVVFKAYKYSSKCVLVPTELLEDSAFDMASLLGSLLGERLGRISNTQQTTGSGSSQPNGVVTASSEGKEAASASAITFDEVLDLIHSVDRAYRDQSSFMFHDSTLKAIRKLKDGEGQYLWQPSLQVGAPPQILGYPFVVNNDMAEIGTGNKTILFGDMSKYKIREVRGVRMLRLVERYKDFDQDGFLAFLRMDANLVDAGTNPIKHLVQA